MDLIYEKILHMTHKKNINVLLVNFADAKENADAEIEKYETRFKLIKTYKVVVDSLKYDYAIADRTYLNKKIGSSDIIRLGWGNPVTLKNKLNAIGWYVKILHTIKYANKVVVWNSAGSLIFFRNYIKSLGKRKSNGNYTHQTCPGFWLIDWLWVVHFSEWKRKEYLQDFSLKLNMPGIGIDEKAGMVLGFNGQSKLELKEIIKIKDGNVWFFDNAIASFKKITHFFASTNT